MPMHCTSANVVRLPRFFSGGFLRLLVWASVLASAIVARADYPLVSHKFSADPTGLEFNGRLYLYCSNDTDNDTNGGYTMHSISCYSSDDLKNWTDHGEVLQVPRDVSWATYSWAPSAISNNGMVHLYFANGAGSIGVATNSSPTGPFKDAKGSSLINSSTPGASTANQWYFDPCIFLDGGQPYLYFGGADPTNARVIQLNANLTSVSGSASSMASSNFFEASMMHKRGSTYYFSYSSSVSAGLTIQYATNSNPTSGFVFMGNVVPNPPHNSNNNNHHAFFTYQGVWYCAYHNRYLAEQLGIPTTYKRNVCLDVLNYNADGTMQQVVCTTNGLTQLKYLNPYNQVEAETMAQQSGIATEPCVEGGMDVTNIFNGNWTMLRGVDFTSAGATNFTARIASAGTGGNIELHLDATNGTLIGNCAVSATGGWQTWANASCAVTNATTKSVHDLYLKFTGASATNLFNFNYWQFQSATNIQSPVSLVKFEAESGTLGSDFAVSNSTSPAYITILTDNTTNNPASAARVATYTVTFPAAGTYQLYAHVLVGPGGFNDDSMFYGNGFGVKNPTSSSDWILVNGLAAAGFSNSTDVVTGGGSLGSGIWKWINLSQFTSQAGFTVSAGSLTQTFQIGARENGLDLDKFAFGTVGTAFTVSNLDTGTIPPPSNINTNPFVGPDGITFHRFSALVGGLNQDGANPAAGLALSGGVLCGTTLNGGSQSAGTAFWMTPEGTNFSAFRSFTNAPDAGNPQGELSFAGSRFFSTSFGGGTSGVGTVFAGQTNGSVSLLRSFSSVSADTATNSGGASPNALLALSGSTLYGTTTAGGAGANGTVFSMSTNGSSFSVLHDFTVLDSNTGTNTDGALPCGGLILSGSTLYGTASAGGNGGVGVVFSVNTSGGSFTTLYSFTALDPVAATNTDGAFPSSGLVLSNGMLYGTTIAGGTGGKGVIYSVGANGLGFGVLHNFSATDPLTGTNSDGASPFAPLVLSSNYLYGTASAGGASANGTVFSVSTNGAQFQTIHAFTAMDSSTGTNTDGAFPVAGLLPLGSSLYGTTFSGGPGGAGTVFNVAIPYPPAVITNIVRNLDGSVTLYFLGGPNSTNMVQTTTNLAPPSTWLNVSTNVAGGGGAWQFTETNTTNSTRFYRSYAP